jgi:DNA-binding CsgD family transcriptional regulator
MRESPLLRGKIKSALQISIQLSKPTTGNTMKSTQERSDRRTKNLCSLPAEFITTEGYKLKRRSGEAARSALLAAATAPALLTELGGSSQFAQPVRRAFNMLKDSVDEATAALENNNSHIAVELKSLHTRSIQSICACALALIDYVEALSGAAGPSAAAIEIEHFRRQGDGMDRRLAAFFESASNMISVLTDPLNNQLREFSHTPLGSKIQCDNEEILARVRMLTSRQKRIAELLVQGMPSKIMAFELGVTETTVKAHVSNILRKLCVHSRARAVAMLAKIDLASMASIASGSPHAIDAN